MAKQQAVPLCGVALYRCVRAAPPTHGDVGAHPPSLRNAPRVPHTKTTPAAGAPPVSSAPEPPAPGWHELHALWPLLVLVCLVFVWTELEFASALSTIKAMTAVVVVIWILKWLPDKTQQGARLDFANFLRSRTLARRLWTSCAVFLLGTLLLGSVAVRADGHAARTRIYSIDPAGATRARDASFSARTLDDKHVATFLIGLPIRRAVRFASTNNDVSVVVSAWPWFVPTLTYPEDFRPLPELMVLPSPRLRLAIGRGKWLRLLVLSDDAPQDVLADDTLQTYGSRVVVFDSARVGADTLAARWRLLAADSLQLDSALTVDVVDEWLKSRRLVRSTRLLVPGQHVRVIMVNQRSDTMAHTRTTLTSGLSNVVLRD